MESKPRELYHIVLVTEDSKPVIPNEHRKALYRHLWDLFHRVNCVMYRIGGGPEHVHICCDLPPVFTPQEFARYCMSATAQWMWESNLFPVFVRWEPECVALRVPERRKQLVVEFIRRQEEVHRKWSFQAEHKVLLKEMNVETGDALLI